MEKVYSFLAQEIEKGRQAYVVYPVIEESETLAVKAAEQMYQQLSQLVFPNIRGGFVAREDDAGRKGIRHAALRAGTKPRFWCRPPSSKSASTFPMLPSW